MKSISILLIIILFSFCFALPSFAGDLMITGTRATYPYDVGLSPTVWYSSDGLSVVYSASIDPNASVQTYSWQWITNLNSSWEVIENTSTNTFNFNWLDYSDVTYFDLRVVAVNGPYPGPSNTIQGISNTVSFYYNGLPVTPSPDPSPVPDPGPTVDPQNPLPTQSPIPIPTPYPTFNPGPGDPTYGYWEFIKDFFADIFSFMTPWGIAFGAVVVGVFGLPLLVKAIKKFF